MTGLIITQSTRSGPVPSNLAPEGSFFVVGQAERGRTDVAVRVGNLNEFVAEFGGRVTYGVLYDQVRTFFEEGGGIAYVARVVGPSATVGTLTLQDRAGSPQNSVRVDALAPGAHSSRLSVQVVDGSATGLFSLLVFFDGTVVESYVDLATPTAAVQALASSRFVRATDLGSTTPPSTTGANNPKVLAATALSAGTDDRTNIATSHSTAALARFTKALGTGVVAIPSIPLTLIAAAIEAHCRATQRIAYTCSAQAASRAQVKADRTTALAAITAAAGEPERVGLIAPWVTIPDVGATTRVISPEGYLAGRRAATIADVGVWQAPAGEYGAAQFVVGLTDQLDDAAVQDYDAAGVIPLTLIADPDGSGTQAVWVYGYRSLSNDQPNWRLLSSRDVCNLITYRAGIILQRYAFKIIDSGGTLVLHRVEAELIGVADPIAAANGLYADPDGTDRGYSVDVGPALNPPSQLAANTIAAQLAVRPSPTGESILLNIVKAAPLATV